MKKLNTVAATFLILTLPIIGQAQPKYDSETNTVTLSTPVLYDYDRGSITIFAEDHIEVRMSSFEREKKRLVYLCANDPSLGILVINGRSNFNLAPEVTDVMEMKIEGEGPTGWAVKYILKGDSAFELIDLMYENQSVGFATTNSDCPGAEVGDTFAFGSIMAIWDTNGLERVMKRMK